MKRVMIIGGSGSGKSTLARYLGQATGLPVFHLDQIYWQPGWVERPESEAVEQVQKVHASEDWILEGNYSRTFPERIARADTCVWLDFPIFLRMWRIIWRSIRFRGKITYHPLKTARKSTNSEETTIRFLLFFRKIKVEIRGRENTKRVHLKSLVTYPLFP